MTHQPFRLADSIAANMGAANPDAWTARVEQIRARYPNVTDAELAAMYAAHLEAIEARTQITRLRESVAMSVFKAHLALAGFALVVLFLLFRSGQL